MGSNLFYGLPSLGGFGQGYNSVGWLFHDAILLFFCSSYRNNILLQDPHKPCDTITLKTYSQHKPDHSPQTAPPLALCAPGKVGAPSLFAAAHADALLYLGNAGAKPTKITRGTHSVHSSTTGASKTTEIHRLRQAGEISKNEAMPPQTPLTARAAGRLLPRKKTAKTGNFLDLNGYKKYQWSNSLQDGLGPGWRG